MGESKISVLLETATANLGRAEEAEKRGEWDDSILHASLAVENAANALIVRLGGHEAMDHRTASALNAVALQRAPEWTLEKEFQKMVRCGLAIQREVVYSRYPHHVNGRWIAPTRFYTAGDSRKAVSNARFVLETVRDYLDRRP